MAGTLTLHDSRLHGFPNRAAVDHVVTVNGSTDLSMAFGDIIGRASESSGLERVNIMCHGYERVYSSPTQRESRQIGGAGLKLCRQGLNNTTVAMTSDLKDYVDTFVVYACSAADTHPDMIGTDWDGQRLFREMAAWSDATVFAADVTQWYYMRNPSNMTYPIIDFSTWEGNVWRFDPDGSARIVESNPIR